MNDFTVLMQIEKQMQDQFRATEEIQTDLDRHEPKLASWRLRLGASLRAIASAIEPAQPDPACTPSPERQASAM